MTVAVIGEKELLRKLAALSAQVAGEALESACVAGALEVWSEARRTAPVKTGNLRRSIHIGGYAAKSGGLQNTTGTDLRQNKRSKTSAEVVVGTNVEYATSVEYGSARRPPKPYLRPAYDSKGKDFARVAGEVARHLIERAVR